MITVFKCDASSEESAPAAFRENKQPLCHFGMSSQDQTMDSSISYRHRLNPEHTNTDSALFPKNNKYAGRPTGKPRTTISLCSYNTQQHPQGPQVCSHSCCIHSVLSAHRPQHWEDHSFGSPLLQQTPSSSPSRDLQQLSQWQIVSFTLNMTAPSWLLQHALGKPFLLPSR